MEIKFFFSLEQRILFTEVFWLRLNLITYLFWDLSFSLCRFRISMLLFDRTIFKYLHTDGEQISSTRAHMSTFVFGCLRLHNK